MGKRLKKVLSAVLAAAILFGSMGAGVAGINAEIPFATRASAASVANLTYKIENGEVIITHCDENASGELEIPAAIDGKPVTSIGGYSFAYCKSLTSVTIPDSVTSIGYRAFYNCKKLTNVIIPDSVTSIGDDVFDGCAGLTSVTIPDSVTSIGGSAFKNCTGLTSVTIPDSVTSIGGSAFYGCKKLTSVTIPDSVTKIESSTFSGCSSLTSVTIPDSITSIGSNAFSGCASLTSVTIPDGVTSIGEYAFKDCESLTSVTIPDSVTSIGEYAFSGCSGLTNVTIPDSVTSIGSNAFYNCTGLTSVTIGSGLTSIGNSCLLNSPNLAEITVASGNSKYSILDGVLFNKDKTKLIKYPPKKAGAEYTIPDSVTSIGGSAFYNTGIYNDENNWENGVLYIGNHLIKAKSGVVSRAYTIKAGTKTIADGAFAWCSSLASVAIPDSVTSIGYEAFVFCTSLTSVTIPDSVTSIGYRAFACTSLTSVTIGNGVTEIGYDAFWNCTGLTSVTIPDSVTSIGDWAFYGCKSLTSVTIGNGVTSVGEGAFDGCASLESITIGNGVTEIGWGAFRYCSALTDVYYGGSETDWRAIAIVNYGNASLRNANIHYNWTPTHVHEYEWIVVKEPQIGVEGLEVYKCKVCGNISKERAIPALSFTPEDFEIKIDAPEMKYGETNKITVGALPEGYEVRYKAEPEGIVEVDKNGNIKTVGEGTATVTATVVDANGNEVKDANGRTIAASQKVTVKRTLMQKIVLFFENILTWLRKLFSL